MKSHGYKNKISFIIWVSIILITFSVGVNQYNKEDIEVINIGNQRKYVYPLGNIVGVKADTDGVLVIGFEESDVEYIGGIQKGDNIVKINGQNIKNSEDVKYILNKIHKDEVEVNFEREGEYKSEIIKTKYENGRYSLGLWVRDKISGMGTLTCYEPDSKEFKAIGHAITDIDTNKLLKIKQGYIYNPTNIEIVKGNDNKVGQIKGNFSDTVATGNFHNNSDFGISGNLDDEKGKTVQLIEVGSYKDVKVGNAVILFEDANRNIRSYDIKIESIAKDTKSGRDMVIKVTDEDLIDYTGGIIQGMSGAPIIQNNKIIGALTHVFRDNPKKGYGIFINEMLELENR